MNIQAFFICLTSIMITLIKTLPAILKEVRGLYECMLKYKKKK